jgi:Pyridoxamine 5'-phosphate oxidase
MLGQSRLKGYLGKTHRKDGPWVADPLINSGRPKWRLRHEEDYSRCHPASWVGMGCVRFSRRRRKSAAGVPASVLIHIKAVESGTGQAVVRLLRSGTLMDDTLKSKILELVDQHRLMTLATNRPDGWPQATTVGYVRDYRCASVPNLLANRNPGQSDRGFCPYSMVAI